MIRAAGLSTVGDIPVHMARRLMTVDRAPGSFVVACQCGFRAMGLTRDAVRVMADRHRAEAHPRQATYLASKRKARGIT